MNPYHKFGEENIETEIPVTEPEVHVRLFGIPISIKTISGKNLTGLKLIWTVDTKKANEFRLNNDTGGLYWFPTSAQLRVFQELGSNNYIRLPKPGTNPK